MNINPSLALNVGLWLFAALGVFSLIGKQIGVALVKIGLKSEELAVSAIPFVEIRENARSLIKQANSWLVGKDGKEKMDWVVAQICIMYPVVAAVVRPIAQAAYEQIKKEILEQQAEPLK